MILSHNISAVLTAIFALVYSIVHRKNWSATRVKKGLLMDILLILGMSSFFWLPLLETKVYTNYRVYEPNAMATQESFLSHALKIKDLFITKKDSALIFEIGLPVILMLAFSVMTFRKLEENKKEYLFFLFSGLLSIGMTTQYFPWKYLPNCIYIIQFPWRMLLFASFFLAIVCSINMSTLIKKFNGKDVLVFSVICLAYLWTRYSVIPYAEEVIPIENASVSEVTSENNAWLPGMGRLEYLPSKAYEKNLYLTTREPGILTLEGECVRKESVKSGTYMRARIITKEEKVKLELPFIYYPGYTVKLDGMFLETFETENGFLGCSIEELEEGNLEVTYTGTKIMQITKMLSLISWIVCGVYVWKKH